MNGSDPLTFFDRIHDQWTCAAESAGATLDHHYELAGSVVRLRFAGPALQRRIAPAFAHLETGAPAAPDLTVCLWDSASTGVSMPPPPWRTQDYLAHGMVRGYCDERMLTVVRPTSGALSIYDATRRLALWWYRSAEAVPPFECGSPLIQILHRWSRDRGIRCLHAGAVGTPAAGVVIAGRSGSGKSTACLACVGSPLRYAADECCLLRMSDGPRLFSLYCTGKLDRGGLERLPALWRAVVNPDLGEDKGLIRLFPSASSALIRSFPVRALAVPRISEDDQVAMHHIAPAEAFRMVAPNCAFEFGEPDRGLLQDLGALVRQVPSFRLELGRDLARVPDVILGVL